MLVRFVHLFLDPTQQSVEVLALFQCLVVLGDDLVEVFVEVVHLLDVYFAFVEFAGL